MATKMRRYLLLLVISFVVGACDKAEEPSAIREKPVPEAMNFSVNSHYILKNSVPFLVKGMVYVPGYPGYLPWEIEKASSLPSNLTASIDADMANIRAMGANTIRLWGAPTYCYEALRKTPGLHFIQTIWIKGDAPDFQDQAFKENTKAYIREVVNRIYAVFGEQPLPLVAFLVGNELSEASILSTNSLHPDINSYSGRYIRTGAGVSATEAFIAEMADYTKSYEQATYGHTSLVSYANDIRTANLLDTPFLDFVSHNAYAYAVPYYRPGTASGSGSGTKFQGWVEEIKSRNPQLPLLITETGLSVSPNAHHVGPPNYGYGGNTEQEQQAGLVQNLQDISSTALPTAGVCVHEYLDAWWKFGLQDSFSQDPHDVEEWFGIVRIKPSGNWYATEFRSAYTAIKQLWAK